MSHPDPLYDDYEDFYGEAMDYDDYNDDRDYDEDNSGELDWEDDYDDSMDGDHDSAMESAGWGLDEQYGLYESDYGDW